MKLNKVLNIGELELCSIFYKKEIFSLWDICENRFVVAKKISNSNKRIYKFSFLFTEKNKAEKIIMSTTFNRPDILIKEIDRTKPIICNFDLISVDYFLIDGSLKISYQEIRKLEDNIRK